MKPRIFQAWLQTLIGSSRFSDSGTYASIIDSQQALSKEANRLLLDIRERLNALNDEVEFMSAHVEPDISTLLRVQREQELLRWQIRRLQATTRTTQELEQEYQDWIARMNVLQRTDPHGREPSELEQEMNALNQRLEIVVSELRIRGKDAARLDSSSFFEKEEGNASFLRDESQEHESSCSEGGSDLQEAIRWERGEASNLLREIEEAERELRRAQHSDSVENRDLYEIVSGLRRHHGMLRLMDRAEGKRRVRCRV